MSLFTRNHADHRFARYAGRARRIAPDSDLASSLFGLRAMVDLRPAWAELIGTPS
jgi:hypothetical protein